MMDSRIDIIGSNGNDGLSYSVEVLAKLLAYSDKYPTMTDILGHETGEVWRVYSPLALDILIALEKEDARDADV